MTWAVGKTVFGRVHTGKSQRNAGKAVVLSGGETQLQFCFHVYLHADKQMPAVVLVDAIAHDVVMSVQFVF